MVALRLAHGGERLLMLGRARDGAPPLPLARDSLAAQHATSFVALEQRGSFHAVLRENTVMS